MSADKQHPRKSKEQVRETRAPYTVKEHELEALASTLSPLSPRVRQVVRIIQEFKTQERDQFLQLLPTLLNISLKDYGWLKMAESSFEFWDNEEDAVYDRL